MTPYMFVAYPDHSLSLLLYYQPIISLNALIVPCSHFNSRILKIWVGSFPGVLILNR